MPYLPPFTPHSRTREHELQLPGKEALNFLLPIRTTPDIGIGADVLNSAVVGTAEQREAWEVQQCCNQWQGCGKQDPVHWVIKRLESKEILHRPTRNPAASNNSRVISRMGDQIEENRQWLSNFVNKRKLGNISWHDHDKPIQNNAHLWTAIVEVAGTTYGRGQGGTKSEARENAARQALAALRGLNPT